MMVGYLLGTASELEQSQIETRYFREPHFYEQVLALEEELICDYLNEVLTAAERRRFEQYFLASPRRLRKYESTRKLMTFVTDQEKLKANNHSHPSLMSWLAAWPERLHSFFIPKLNFVWSLAVVAVLSLAVWMLSLQVAALRQEIDQKQDQQVATKKAKQRTKAKLDKGRAGADNQRNPVAEIADQLQASLDPTFIESDSTANLTDVLSINLRPSQLRSPNQAPRISLPANVTTLRLRLTLGNAAAPQITSYNAVLKTLGGQEILRRLQVSKQVVQSGKSLTLEVPAQRLKPGYYALSLTSVTINRKTQPAEEFFIQIVR
jgi:hypothetical protein